MNRFITLTAIMLTLALTPAAGWAVSDSRVSPEETAIESTTVPEEATSAENPAGPAFVTDDAQHPVEAAEDHGGGGLPQLNVTTYPSQIFWLLVSFAILYMLFSRVTLPALGGMIAARENKINSDLGAAEALREKAEMIQASYEKNLEQARGQAISAVQDVESDAKLKLAAQMDVFRARAEAEMAAAESRMDAAKVRAMDDMTTVAAEVAAVAAEKITGVGTDVGNARAVVESLASKAKAA